MEMFYDLLVYNPSKYISLEQQERVDSLLLLDPAPSTGDGPGQRRGKAAGEGTAPRREAGSGGRRRDARRCVVAAHFNRLGS